MKKLLIAVGALFGIVLLLALGAALLVKPDRILSERREAIAAQVSQTLGRELTIGGIDGRLLPSLQAEATDVTLAGAEGAAEPQARVARIRVEVALWKALLSFGRDLEVRSVELEGLTVRAARSDAGRWDFQDVLDHLAGSESPDDEPTDLGFLEGARLTHAAVRDARIVVHDAALGRPLAVEGLNLEVRDIELGEPIAIALRAELVDGGTRSPLTAEVKLGELDRTLAFDPMPDVSASMNLGALALGPWGSLLPPDVLAPDAGTVGGELDLEVTGGLARLQARGALSVEALVLRHGEDRGRPLSLEVGFELGTDEREGSWQVERLDARGSGMELLVKGRGRGYSLTALSQMEARLSVKELASLAQVVPRSAGLVPAELVLEGPVQARLEATDVRLALSLDLDAARVGWARDFDKRAGRPLHLTLEGTREGDRLVFPGVDLTVDAARMTGSLELGTAPGAPFAADLRTGQVPIASLRALLPPVDAALGRGSKVSGTLESRIEAAASEGRQRAAAYVRLVGIDLDLQGLTAKGNGSIEVGVRPREKASDLSLSANLDAMTLKTRDEAGGTLLDKPAGMAMRFDVSAVHKGDTATLTRAALAVGGTSVVATGRIVGLEGPRSHLQLSMNKLDVAFDDLRRTLPGAESLPPGGRFRGNLSFEGEPARASTLALEGKVAELSWKDTRLSGDVSLRDFDTPQFRFLLNGPSVDIDAFLGEDDPNEVDENPHGLDADTRALLATVSGEGTLTVGRALYYDVPMQNVKAKLWMKRGVVTFDVLEFQAYGGKFSAPKTMLDLPRPHTAYRIQADIQQLDLGAALAAHTSLGTVLSGRSNHVVDLSGEGLSFDDFARTALGQMKLDTEALRISSLDVLGGIAAPLAGVLAKAGQKKFAGFGGDGGTELKNLSTLLKFDKGRFRMQSPVESATRFGALLLEGGGALDTTLDLVGTARLSPETVNRAAGRNAVSEAIPAPLKIGGTWTRPKITDVDVGPLAKALVAGLAGSVGADSEALEQARRESADRARQKVEESKQAATDARRKAEEEARRKAEETRKAAADKKKELEEKARQEAEKKKEEAKDKVKDAAKKILGL